MKARNSLRTRLILAYAGLILIGFVGLAAFAGQQISAGTITDFENQLQSQASLISRGLREPWEHVQEGESSPQTLLAQVQDYEQQFDLAIDLLNDQGQLWPTDQVGDANISPTTPEVITAMQGQVGQDVRQNVNGSTIVYTAAPVVEDGKLIGIVTLTAPAADAQSLVGERWLTMGIGVLILALLALIASYWLSLSFTRPLSELRTSALRVAEGDFSQRIPETRQDEIGQVAGAFNHMAGQVETMVEEQRAFASNASHELRTPLTTIRLRSEALRAGDLDEATAQQYIIEIDDEIVRLETLVQDLGLLSRLEAGRLQPGHEHIDLVRLAQSLMKTHQPQAAMGQITMSLNCTAAHPPAALGNLSHLHVVFRNLLHNALKYTPPGGTIIWQLRQDGQFLHTTISDNGQGISAEDLPHLFDRFYRADKSRGRDVPGSGLGLSLVQMVVTTYGGKVTVNSPGLGKGTAVDVWWPVATAVDS